MKTPIQVLVVFVIGIRSVVAQGFVNFNFEAANVSAYGAGPAVVPITNALPGWNGYIGTSSIVSIYYNTIAISLSAVSLHSSFTPGRAPLQGNYSVFLQGSTGPFDTASIAQTGQIPQGTKSIFFLASIDPLKLFQVSFSGQPLQVVQVGSTANNVMLAGDISAFAGQTGELRFTGLQGPLFSGGLYLDDIQFSTQAIPEPSVAVLSALGAGLLGWLWRKRIRV